ncbi:MAG: TonB-dependent receptor [Paludibacteraceae bacterium]|nr:TonB-dependent receptor [Paludibacteraceae bacterium]
MWRCLTILTSFLLFFSVQMAGAKKISGVVTNAVGDPLDVVNVEVDGEDEAIFTDPLGRFSLQLSSDSVKTYRLQFSLIGYADVQKSVLCDRDSVFVRVVMKESSVSLGDVDVVALKKQETTIEVMNVDVTKSIPTMSGDAIKELVTTMPGVSSNNELSSQYSVRGGNFDENCVYVNSIEVYRPFLIRSGEQEGLSFMNPDLVQSVNFSSGGFSPEYGDKIASVLDIKYKTPSAFEGSVSVSLLGASAYIGTSSPKFSQVHGFRYKKSTYVLNGLQTVGDYDPRFLDYQTYMTYRFSPKCSLSFLGNISRNDYRFSPESSVTNFGTNATTKSIEFYFDGEEKDLFSTFFGALTLNIKPSKKCSIDLIGSSFYTSENVTYDITSSYLIGDLDMTTMKRTTTEGAGGSLQHARNELNANVTNFSYINTLNLRMNTLKWGTSFQLEKMEETINEWEYRDSAGYSMPMNGTSMMLYDNCNADLKEDMFRFSCFAQNTFNRMANRGKVVLVGGLRLSYWNFNHQLMASPRLSFSYFPKETNWGFRFATGIYHQSLFFKEMMCTEKMDNGNVNVYLNHDVKSPRSAQIIAASDFYFRKWGRPFKLTTELYYKYLDRIIPYQVDNMKITYMGRNCAKGFAFGGDVKLSGEFVPGTDSWVSLSLMNTKEDIEGDEFGYIPRPTDQRFNASMFFQDYMPGFDKLKFNIKLIWSDGFPFTLPNTYSHGYDYWMKNYKRIDIGLTFHLRKGVDPVMQKKFFSWMKTFALNFDVFNLLGTKNVNSQTWISVVNGSQYAVPNYLTGRMFNAKLTIDF